MSNSKKENKKLLWVAIVICLTALATMTIIMSRPEKVLVKEFVPPAFEENAEVGIPDVPDNLGWSELDAKVYKVSVCGKIKLNEKAADVWFMNSEENNVWLKLRVLDSGNNIIGETGVIKPGEYVRSVQLETLPENGDEIVLKVMGYEIDTYYSAGSIIVNTKVAE